MQSVTNILRVITSSCIDSFVVVHRKTIRPGEYSRTCLNGDLSQRSSQDAGGCFAPVPHQIQSRNKKGSLVSQISICTSKCGKITRLHTRRVNMALPFSHGHFAEKCTARPTISRKRTEGTKMCGPQAGPPGGKTDSVMQCTCCLKTPEAQKTTNCF